MATGADGAGVVASRGGQHPWRDHAEAIGGVLVGTGTGVDVGQVCDAAHVVPRPDVVRDVPPGVGRGSTR